MEGEKIHISPGSRYNEPGSRHHFTRFHRKSDLAAKTRSPPTRQHKPGSKAICEIFPQSGPVPSQRWVKIHPVTVGEVVVGTMKPVMEPENLVIFSPCQDIFLEHNFFVF